MPPFPPNIWIVAERRPPAKSFQETRLTAMPKRSLISLLTLTLLLAIVPCAKAYDSPLSLVHGGKKAGIIIGLIAIPVAIGIVIYAVHRKHAHTLKGCAVSSPGGLQLIKDGGKQTYDLVGATAMIKSGDRVQLNGKKIKVNSNQRQFVVEKVSKDYGACEVSRAAP